MKRKLFLLLCALLTMIGVQNVKAYQTPTADGIYYIQNVETGKFLCRGNDWGSRATVSDFGSTWILVEDNGRYHIRVASLVGASVNQGLGDDYWMYADCSGDRDRTYTLTLISDGQYTMTGSGISMNVYAYTKDDVDKFCVAGNATLDDNMTSIKQSYWRFLSQGEYDAVIASRISTQESTVATSAGYDLADLGKTLTQLVSDVNTFANKGVQATVTATTDWTWTPEANRNGGTGTGNDLVEAFEAPGKFTKTISGLTEGIYKVSIPALFRESNNEACYSLHESGYEPAGGCYISANGNTTSVSSWASGATSKNYPNIMADAKARIDDGAYSNELYCYVDESGNLNLEVGVPGWYEINQWVGSWFIMGDATATLYSDAVSDGDATAILATANELLNQEMDATIKTNLTNAKNTFDEARTIANYKVLQTAIVAAQASADAYARGAAINALIVGERSVVVNEEAVAESWTPSPERNTWSSEGDTDGSNMKTPFLQNWRGSGGELPDNTNTYLAKGVKNGNYEVTALVRILKENGGEISATSATFGVNDVTDNLLTGTEACTHGIYKTASVRVLVTDNTLDIKLAYEGANFNWISWKNLKVTYLDNDFTSIIKNADCTSNDYWEGGSGGGRTFNSMEAYDGETRDVFSANNRYDTASKNGQRHQTITLPATGAYKLAVFCKVDGTYSNGYAQIWVDDLGNYIDYASARHLYTVDTDGNKTSTINTGGSGWFANEIYFTANAGDSKTIYINLSPGDMSISGRYELAYVSGMKLTYLGTAPEISFDEAIVNPVVKVAHANVTIARNMKSDRWNTFTVPFSMAKPVGWTVKELTGVDYNESTSNYSLNFEEASSIVAGKAYMVKPESNVIEVSADDVTINTSKVEPSEVSDEGYTASFVGNNSYMTKVPTGSYIISNNVFYIVDSSIIQKGFRGYITVSGNNSARATVSFGTDEDVTGIQNVVVEGLEESDALKDGKYLINGKIVIVKNGVKYSANGQKLN